MRTTYLFERKCPHRINGAGPSGMSTGYTVVPSQSTRTRPAPPDWQTGLCECCAGENQCCLQCCLVAFGLDFCLFKNTEEWYIQRQRGLKYDDSVPYVPDSLLEKCIGNQCYRGIGVLCTCGLVAATGGVFSLLWCCLLARQRSQVRKIYRIDGNPCCDCLLASCCRCCMFNQLKHQLKTDPPSLDWTQPQLVNSMRVDRTRTATRRGP
jgi:hypothetical protein